MKTTIPGLLVLLLIAPAAQAANRGQQYILLFKQPNASAPPPVVLDAVVGAGGKVEAQGIDRVRVTLPAEAAAAMRKHPGTRWLQRAVPGVEAVRVAGAQLAGSVPRPGNLRAESQAGRLEQQPTAGWASGTYAYDGSGNIVAIGTSTYAYDGLSRLTDATLEGATVHYDYDANGNMTGRTSARLEVSSLSQSVDASNHLTGATYDEAGNVTSYAGETYSYDPLSKMRTKSSNGTRELYLYTAGDERIGVRSGEDHWLWSLRDERGRVLRQYETSEWTPAVGWTWIEDYVYREGELVGGERMAEEGGRRHFHLDHLGTPRLITGGGGSMIARHDYTPYGDEITPGDPERRQGFSRDEPMRFTGHERDLTPGTLSPETSYTDYMHARVASTGWGRFLSVDPIIDVEAAMRNPQMWNRYSYVANDPINRIDPTGKLGCKVNGEQIGCHVVVVYDKDKSKGTIYLVGEFGKGKNKTEKILLQGKVVVGADGKTPTGTFTAGRWEKDHVSTKYGWQANTPWSKSPMGLNAFGPYQLHIKELESRGIWIHGTMGPGRVGSSEFNRFVSPTSHGCVRCANPTILSLHDMMPEPQGNKITISTNAQDAPDDDD